METNELNYDVQIAIGFSCFDFDPKLITENLQVTPDRAVLKGENKPKLGLPKTNLWSRRSYPDKAEAELDEHWDFLLQEFSGKEAQIFELSKSTKLIFAIIVPGRNGRSMLTFPAEALKFLGQTGGILDIDIYPTDEDILIEEIQKLDLR